MDHLKALASLILHSYWLHSAPYDGALFPGATHTCLGHPHRYVYTQPYWLWLRPLSNTSRAIVPVTQLLPFLSSDYLVSYCFRFASSSADLANPADPQQHLSHTLVRFSDRINGQRIHERCLDGLSRRFIFRRCSRVSYDRDIECASVWNGSQGQLCA